MSGIPGDQVGPLMHQLVPMVATLGLVYESVSDQVAVVRLVDLPAYRNHVGGPHAAAMFAAAESATGAVAVAAFGDLLDRAVLVPTTATIDFLSIAKGDLTATATLNGDPSAVRAQFESGTRPEFDITVVIANADGQQTGRMTARWTLKRHKTDQ